MRHWTTILLVIWALLVLCGFSLQTLAEPPLTDKTLVSWAAPADCPQRGGSILTINTTTEDRFDGIVYGELNDKVWMAGSNSYSRTDRHQENWAKETAGPNDFVQMAIVYRGMKVTIFRNGALYAEYAMRSAPADFGANAGIVLGPRHIQQGGTACFIGKIRDVRVYSEALDQKVIQAMKPGQPVPGVKPYAWWNFASGGTKDEAGRFNTVAFFGDAKIKNDCLVIGQDRGAMLAVQAESAGALMNSLRNTVFSFPTDVSKQFETPAMPKDVPDTWLTYHLAHPGPGGAVPADPNCAIYQNGRFHLHYIYQQRGHSFGHVSSADMVFWKWHPTVLTPPNTGHGMFSGTAFRTLDDRVAIIYHGAGSGRNQLAFALDDDLNSWTLPRPIKMKDDDGQTPPMRHWDPDCWIIGDTYYALSGGRNPTIATSKDMQEWTFQGELFHDDFPEDLGVAKSEDVSCANMFRIGDRWMLLCISHQLGARYYLGDFKDGKFLPTSHAMLNWARWDYFAPESLLTPDGRRVIWAWCTPWVNSTQKVGREKNFDKVMRSIQPGVISLPREVELTSAGTLAIRPLTELKKLRYDETAKENITVAANSVAVVEGITGDKLELEVTFEAPQSEEFGINLCGDRQGENGFRITAGKNRKTLTADYSEPPFALEEGENLTLRIFIDKSMIEIFANDRQAVVAWCDHAPENQSISLFSKGKPVKVKTIKAWKMKSIY